MRKFKLVFLLVFLFVSLLAVMPISAQEGGDPVSILPIPTPALTGQWIAGVIFVVLLVLLEYIPGFAEWWDTVPGKWKKFWIACTGLLIEILLIVGHYGGVWDLQLGTFGWPVIGMALNALLAFLGGAEYLWSFLLAQGAIPRKANE